MRNLLFVAVLSVGLPLFAQPLRAPFEISGGKSTFTYQEGITFCRQLDSLSPYIQLLTYGTTDFGEPLHLLVLDASQKFTPATSQVKILVNNAIHAGEPDGVDASLLLLRDIALDPSLLEKYKNCLLLVIPFYNTGGVHNRGAYSRANQDGPEQYGFRGNARNLDLNRDFMKADAAETRTFYQIFHTWQPDVFVDNHVSNGADYQYTMTLICSQEEKMGPRLGKFQKDIFLPELFAGMKQKGEEMVPYVNVFHTVPDSGYEAFMETPRYTNGYTALFGCISFVSETHMLKPFAQRVKATRTFLETLFLLSSAHPEIRQKKQLDTREMQAQCEANQGTVEVAWECRNAKNAPAVTGKEPYCDTLQFKGYRAVYKKSEVTGLDRLYYDRSQPFTRKIPFYDGFNPLKKVQVPAYYVVPAQWKMVLERLELNKVQMKLLTRDTLLNVQVYYIGNTATVSQPYEGHYLHYNTEVRKEAQQVHLYAGDVVVIPEGHTLKFLANALEPEAPDSYFNWNFFDMVLQQKEGFSDYVFEDKAVEILAADPVLKSRFEQKKATDKAFAANAEDQLNFIYRNSPYYEKEHRRYPIFRLEQPQVLPVK